jgi:hypothetical protein
MTTTYQDTHLVLDHFFHSVYHIIISSIVSSQNVAGLVPPSGSKIRSVSFRLIEITLYDIVSNVVSTCVTMRHSYFHNSRPAHPHLTRLTFFNIIPCIIHQPHFEIWQQQTYASKFLSMIREGGHMSWTTGFCRATTYEQGGSAPPFQRIIRINLPWTSLTSAPCLAKRSSNLSATMRGRGAAADAIALSEVRLKRSKSRIQQSAKG